VEEFVKDDLDERLASVEEFVKDVEKELYVLFLQK